jgi:hypothetical protein
MLARAERRNDALEHDWRERERAESPGDALDREIETLREPSRWGAGRNGSRVAQTRRLVFLLGGWRSDFGGPRPRRLEESGKALAQRLRLRCMLLEARSP